VTATLPRERVLAIALERSSPTAHASILARAYGIPAVVGATGLLAALALTGNYPAGGLGSTQAIPDLGWLLVASLVYEVSFIATRGQTLGKMALQIRVVSMDGGPLSFGQAVGRYFATFLSALILGIGFIMAGVRSDKRALHDLLAGTRVEYL